jgi:hypothetical protein
VFLALFRNAAAFALLLLRFLLSLAAMWGSSLLLPDVALRLAFGTGDVRIESLFAAVLLDVFSELGLSVLVLGE